MGDDAENRTKFVVGLGNPGRRYERTRHNLGYMVVEVLAGRWSAGPPRKAFSGMLRDARANRPGAGSRRCLMLMPETYMNRSGQAVRELAGFYKAVPEDILVVLDDLALPAGRVRARARGSAGGHKGLADVLRVLGTDEIPRLRIGIGEPPGGMDAVDYVLARFSRDELEEARHAVETAADAVEDWLFNDMAFVMDRYN